MLVPYKWHRLPLFAFSKQLLSLVILVEMICGDRSPWPYVGTTFLKIYYRALLTHAYLLRVCLLGIM